MHRIDTNSAQKDKFGAGKNGFTVGDPQSGTPATEVSAEWLDAIQEEICAVIEAAGITINKGKSNQLLAAIQSSIYPVGSPIPWPLATPPTGFLLMTGQSFIATTYPKLALAYPSLVLPDMRAEFIRGWDNGRGVDVGRVVGSKQADEIKEHKHFISSRYAGGTGTSATGFVQLGYASTEEAPLAWALTNGVENIDGSAAGGNETRPRNIAFNYIVRAA